MSHSIDLNVWRGGITATCTCGRWRGTATNLAAVARGQGEIHLATVGAPKPVRPDHPTWARRYLQGSGTYGGDAA